ncbi:MAG: LemA family protein [Armatimonadota bacterium]|nr:MAG: LemA family protein [Armatimonadota bacterium]
MDAVVAVWIIFGLIGLFILYVIFTYNRMVVLRTRINNAWAQIDVQMRRRYDLIPNLVETVKGYAAHERETLENVTKARAAMAEAKTVQEQAQAQNMITSALKTLFAVAEQYPNLKANENFMMLQEELAGTENKIAYARQFYNDTVRAFNAMIQMFPANIVASMFNFTAREYFEIEEAAAREPVRVTFKPEPPAGGEQ